MTTKRRLRAVKADPHELALDKALAAMSPDMVACRDYGHAWLPQWAKWIAASRCYDTGARCQRCGTLRARLLDQYGAQVSNHYTYADDYLVSGIGRLTGADRDRLRLASVTLTIAAGEGVERHA